MKIMMIAPEPFFEPRGTPFSILGRLKVLSELGHEVDLLTYHVGQDVKISRVSIFRNFQIPFIKKIPVGPSIVKLVVDVFIFIKAISMLQKNKYDLLYTHEEAGFGGVLLSRWFGVPHLYDMHSSLPQQLTNFRYTRLRSLLRLFEWLENKVINSSCAVITICPALEEYVKKIAPNIPQVMIENVSIEGDPQAVSDEALQRFKDAHGLNNEKIVLYVGTFEPYQGLDVLIAAAAQVISNSSNVIFLMIGGTPDQVQHYQRSATERGIAAFFRFTGSKPPDDIPQAIRLSRVLVSPRILGTNTPLKIYSYLHSGRPIVATNLPTHTQVLNGDIAVLVDPNPEAMAKGIGTLLDNTVLAEELGARAKKHFESHYNLEGFVQKTKKVLEMAVR